MGAIDVIRSFMFFFFFFMAASLTPESAAHSRNNGFSVEMIHVDSPSSPFYNSSDTFSSRIMKAALRSLTRFHYLTSRTAASTNEIRPPVISTGIYRGGEFLMQLSLGSNGFKTLGWIDTAGDLIWAQCIPCQKCYPQSTPMFDPMKSSSYTNLDCSSSSCKALTDPSCVGGGCQFRVTYVDGTDIKGDLATDIMTLDSSDGNNISFPIIFGCGHDDSSVTFPATTAGGLVGLGMSPFSLVSQLGSVAKGKFSYCFGSYIDTDSKSMLNFGLQAIVSGYGVVTTPIFTVNPDDPNYFLSLDDITVGSQKLNIPAGTFHPSKDGTRGLIIDSGSAFTYLQQVGYFMMVAALKSAINFPLAQPFYPFYLCYQATKDDIVISFPDVTFHFLGGDVIVGAWNIFVEVNGIACLTVMPASSDLSIYGNIVQQDFHVGYDLVRKTVSFDHADCSQI